jgi:hypothetical protein
MCETNPNIHTNDVGHTKLAAVYEAKLRGVFFAARRDSLVARDEAKQDEVFRWLRGQ